MTIGIPYVYQGFGQNQEPLSYRVVENYKPKSHNAPDTYIQLLEYTMQQVSGKNKKLSYIRREE